MAAQEQAVKTNNIKAKMCVKAKESVNHVLNQCSKLPQKEYERRHDWFGTKIHWEIRRKYGIEVKESGTSTSRR